MISLSPYLFQSNFENVFNRTEEETQKWNFMQIHIQSSIEKVQRMKKPSKFMLFNFFISYWQHKFQCLHFYLFIEKGLKINNVA